MTDALSLREARERENNVLWTLTGGGQIAAYAVPVAVAARRDTDLALVAAVLRHVSGFRRLLTKEGLRVIEQVDPSSVLDAIEEDG